MDNASNEPVPTVICFSRKYSSFDDTWSRPYERNDLNLDSSGEACIFDFDRTDSEADDLEDRDEVEDDLLDRFDSIATDLKDLGGEDSESVYADAFSREASSVRIAAFILHSCSFSSIFLLLDRDSLMNEFLCTCSPG